MEKVKYFLPGIKVKCITGYCRKGDIATIIEGVDTKAVLIKYEDGSTDTARVGHNDNYDLEFVDSQDELLQMAMEKYKGQSFKSLYDFTPIFSSIIIFSSTRSTTKLITIKYRFVTLKTIAFYFFLCIFFC